MELINTLSARAAMLRTIRGFFDDRNFVEVTTPCLTADAIADRFIEPLVVCDDSLPAETMYLHTSPELAMKRLLVAGMTAIYQIAPVFRRGDRGKWHNVEFSMLEYYRTGDGANEGIQLLDELVETVLQRGPVEKISYREMWMQTVGIDPFVTSESALRDVADAMLVHYPASIRDDKEMWLDIIFAERIEPDLGCGRPVIVHSFPPWQSQLAQCANGVAERFELYADGIELANGYAELTDAAEHRARLERTNTLRMLDGHAPLPQPHFSRAMEQGLPPSSGCAVGLDRLLAVKLGAKSIDDVIAFTIEES
ncbi:MAG: EF-P lysine aminoacylase EpmA [Thermoguttaceae bacterium]